MFIEQNKPQSDEEDKQNSNVFGLHDKVHKGGHTSDKTALELIMKQMKLLSDKQIALINTIETMQKGYQKQMSEMNQRITKLESIVKAKEGGLHINDQVTFDSPRNNIPNKLHLHEYRQQPQDNYVDPYRRDDREPNNLRSSQGSSPMRHKDMKYDRITNTLNTDKLWHEINSKLRVRYPTLLQDNFYDSAFALVLNSDDNINLIKFIERTSKNSILNLLDVEDLREVRVDLIETAVDKILNLISRGEFLIICVNWIKGILLSLKLEFKSLIIYQDIKDVMNYHIKNSKHLQEEVLSDLNLIVAYVNNKLTYSAFY